MCICARCSSSSGDLARARRATPGRCAAVQAQAIWGPATLQRCRYTTAHASEGEYNAPVAHYRCTMRSSAQQQPAAHTPASERLVQQNAGRRGHGPVVAAVQKHDGAESCPGLGAFGVARDLQCGRVLPKADVNATTGAAAAAAAAAAHGGGGWDGGGREATHCVKMGAAADNPVHGAVSEAGCVNQCRGAVSALGVLLQAAGGLVCEMIRYAIDAGFRGRRHAL